MRRMDCHDRIKEVTRGHEAAVQTVQLLILLVTAQPALLFRGDLDLPELRVLVPQLHDIYFVRMFASFESSLRHYWRTGIRDSKPLTVQLIASIAARRGVPDDTRDTVQEIREFRNCLIHEEHEARRRFSMLEASGHLNTFLARLPLEW